MIEPTFNELTFNPLCKSDSEVESRLDNFVKLLVKLKSYGIMRVRIEEDYSQIPLMDGLTLSDIYARDSVSMDSAKRNRAFLLAGTLRQPCVTEDIEDKFFGGKDNVEKCICTSITPKQECWGLYVASILNSFSVGFTQPWIVTDQDKMCKIQVVYKDETKVKETAVLCMTSEDDENNKMFVELMSSQVDLPVEENDDAPESKINKFPSHHGKEICEEYAKLIAKCKYVNKILNTIDHNSGEKDFIHKVYENGLIEIRMTWTPRGLGIVVATTGKNKAQIAWIAKHLESNYKK